MIKKIPLSIHSVKVISPMFSYGNGKYSLEPRPTELKGLLRNTYRIANPKLDAKTLYQREVELFGGQLEINKEVVVKASPLCIDMSEQTKNASISKQELRLHREKEWYENGKLQKNYPVKMYDIGKIFTLKLSIRYGCHDFSSIPYLKDKEPIQWYEDLFRLSLLIGGIGKRSRRGRGCMTTDDLLKISYEELSKETAELLNNVCCHTAYSVQEGKVVLASSKGNDNNRPYIKEIRFGQPLEDMTKDAVKLYLKKVDQASHNIKSTYTVPYATGFVKPKPEPKRFSSSVIVSLAEIEDGIVPVYTLLNAVSKEIVFKAAEREQNAFIDNIEGGRKQ